MSPCPRVPSKTPPSLVGTAVLSRPFADRRAHHGRVPILDPVNVRRERSYPRPAQRRVGDNPPYLKTSRRQSTTYLNCPLGPRVLRSSVTPLAPMSPCPRVPSKAPPSLVGTAVLSRPFADRRAHHGRVPILDPVNGGLGTTRPTQGIEGTTRPTSIPPYPRTKPQEPRTLPLPLPLIYFPASNTALNSPSLSGRFQSMKRMISPSKDSFPGCWVASRS